ncbi:phosphoribosylaminoimidazole carboxylase [Basidiobolus meristosporus CBS 931.73]|uniref:Phosphoribosylaminoimidazole carboxylase n=1 Tax=Basidiobolus meristosporus CBS 931.73 TaxID=1314790 RepID=A0A1Y1Z0Q5_9FUNG|nr:phosphoribosylaminoimidazole carboxylase [Basidiobolus meristosporus CBS 931.73]|eukprot:ORY03395.1 phosphoribosylaminoimidazole carboxylase [Basidiobolus meristosporus CBS 931.73]
MDSRTVGVLGGGQLGRMLIEAASRLNINVGILDSPDDAPAKQIAANEFHVKGDFKDPAKISELASKVDVLTVEIEHVNTDILEALEKEKNIIIQPSPATIRLIQDKYVQKVHLSKFGIPLPGFKEINSAEDLKGVAQEWGYPVMLKSKTLAYDGRGNAVVRSEADVDVAIEKLGGISKGLYVERWASFVKELAVMVTRSIDGTVSSYPVVETIQRDNICHLVIAPAQINGAAAQMAKKVAEDAIKTLEGAGIFGVEMFLMEDGSILLNEIAPRPHNSGHYTIEACHTSQFENHLRAILGLPLGSTELKVPVAAMVNILGGSTLEETLQPCAVSLSTPGATVHLYGKKESRKGRKMGHITVVADSSQQLNERLQPILDTIPAAEDGSKSELTTTPMVGVIMGSDSDLPSMKACATILRDFNVPFELTIVSAHRTPDRMIEYAKTAHERGIKVIIAAAGGAAHLPGMVAAVTPLPVIGVPILGKVLDGVDSLYSIVQMPRGVPVATVAIGNSTNAALLAIRMLGAFIPNYLEKMMNYQRTMESEVMTKVGRLDEIGWENY